MKRDAVATSRSMTPAEMADIEERMSDEDRIAWNIDLLVLGIAKARVSPDGSVVRVPIGIGDIDP